VNVLLIPYLYFIHFFFHLKRNAKAVKVFRRLRQRLLAEKKIRNYLLYALGEIVLVVAGILIALAINNFSEQQVLDRKEQTYLKGLQSEFVVSERKLKELIRVNRQNMESARALLMLKEEHPDSLSEGKLSRLLFDAFAFDLAFNPNNSLLNEMINSGSLKDLSNGELRRRLTNWISTLEDIARQEADLALQREKVLDLFRTNDFSLRTLFDQTGISQKELKLPTNAQPASNLALVNSTAFENNVLLFLYTCQTTEDSHYLPLLSELEAILDLVAAEISN
jgi:hypothetical protein